jgi:hypothetical protein
VYPLWRTVPALPPGSKRTFLTVAGAAALLIVMRSLVPTLFEGFAFDSDQAIVGLMARHVATFRHFPLYYYSLNYLLAVQAWIIAPFFWLFRPSVTVMRLPLVLLNILVVTWLLAILVRRLRLSPAMAFVAVLPIVMPTPAVSSQLVEAAGASIEPFVYVLLLWTLRRRPFAFGALLAFGFMHREFTIFALPALVIVEALRGELLTRTSIARAPWIAGGFALIWLVVDDLKMHSSGSALSLQIASLGGQMCVDADLPSRISALGLRALPALVGGRPGPLVQWRMNTPLVAGYSAIAWLVALAVVVTVVRSLRHRDPDSGNPDGGFGLYLAGVGVLTACAYPLSCSVVFQYPPILRYLLFALLVPIGLFVTFVRREPSSRVRAVVVGAFVVWAAVNGFDNARLIAWASHDPPVSEHRLLADYLTSHGIRYATAKYWDAYVVDFLSQERVIVASEDTIRIQEYQDEVAAHAKDAVHLGRLPCEGYDTVASWCIQRP